MNRSRRCSDNRPRRSGCAQFARENASRRLPETVGSSPQVLFLQRRSRFDENFRASGEGMFIPTSLQELTIFRASNYGHDPLIDDSTCACPALVNTSCVCKQRRGFQAAWSREETSEGSEEARLPYARKSCTACTFDTPGSPMRPCLNFANHWISTPAPVAISRYVNFEPLMSSMVCCRRSIGERV
jgi:hypothetical protein